MNKLHYEDQTFKAFFKQTNQPHLKTISKQIAHG